jgi:putative RecB family exonuclease
MTKLSGFRKIKSVLGEEAERKKKELLEQVVKNEAENKKKYFSATKITTYKSCPLKYKFKYVDKINKKLISPSIALGTSFHKAMEYVHDCIVNNIEVTKEALDLIVEETLDRTLCDNMNDEEWKEFILTVKKDVNYYNDHKRKYTPLVINGVTCVEVPFDVQVKNPVTNEPLYNTFLQGSIDMITDDLKIIDFKTSSRSYTEQKVKYSVQPTVYSYAFRQMFNVSEQGIAFDVLIKREKSKSNPEGNPELRNFPTTRTTQDYVQLYNTIKEIIKAEKFNVFCPSHENSGAFCDSCPYNLECKNWSPIDD